MTTYQPRLSLIGYIGDEYPPTEFIGGDAVLRIIDGTRSTTDVGDGVAMESFTVFADAAPNVIRANIRAVQDRLALAHDIRENHSPHDRVQIIERLTDEEETRIATVLGGTITPVDDGVASRTQFRGATLYVITIERFLLWEHGTAQSVRSSSVSSHGGTVDIPARMAFGTQNGRIRTMVVSGNGAVRTKKFWSGIKTSPRIPLSNFDPEIQISRTACQINEGFSVFDDDLSTSGFLDGVGVLVTFNSGTDWARAYSILLPDFNASSASEEYRDIYHGRYHLICRYRTEDTGANEYFGIRAKYGWNTDVNAVTNEPVYVRNTQGEFREVDLGVITIGGDAFSNETINRAKLERFGIAIQAAVWDNKVDLANSPYSSGNLSLLGLDNMFLVPADNYIYVELGTQIGGSLANRRAEVYTHDNDAQYGMVVDRDDIDNLSNPISQYRIVYETIPVIDSTSWSMPTLPSKLVFVADSEGGTLLTAATVSIQLQVATRTVGV